MTSPDDLGAEACHELLVRLAGRLPDRLLWRLREWLAAGRARGRCGAAAAGPAAQSRRAHRLRNATCSRRPWPGRAPRKLLDAVLTVTVPDEPDVTFRSGPDPDVAALSLLAVARGVDGCVELRQTLRGTGRHAQRVVLVRAEGPRPWALAGTLARLLRAHGDTAPCVEVLPGGRSARLPPGRARRLDTAVASPRGGVRRSLTDLLQA
jgi:hypothetical protein